MASTVCASLPLPFFVFAALGFVSAHPQFQAAIPNGFRVVRNGKPWDAVGHASPTSGGGVRNVFGLAFEAAGYRWTPALCALDSDEDGLTNGEELGDPNCLWSPGDVPTRTEGISHPAFADSSEPSRVITRGSIGVAAALVALALITTVSACVARKRGGNVWRTLSRPRLSGWNMSVFCVAVCLVLLAEVVGRLGDSKCDNVRAWGLASGVAAALPVWWACMKFGVHSFVGISRESAWKIHIAFGELALVCCAIHGCLALSAHGLGVFSCLGRIMGCAGMILIYLGVLPAVAHKLFPTLVSYDSWKRLHLGSLLGYMLLMYHVLDNCRKGVWENYLVAGFNVLALAAYLSQMMYVKLWGRTAVVSEANVIDGVGGRYTILRLHVPGLKVAPGQWALLRVPAVASVAHPFTIVPDVDLDHVRFIIKVGGRFTQRLADAVALGQTPAMRLEGPFGRPPLLSMTFDATVFVLGGVGVTPALSLLKEARRTCGDLVRVYWISRSAALLQHCARVLEAHLPPVGSHCIRLSQTSRRAPQLPLAAKMGREDVGEYLTAPDLPLAAKMGRKDVGEYLTIIAEELASKGADAVMLFVCGPPALVRATQKAAASDKVKRYGIAWHFHVETFDFLESYPTYNLDGKPRQCPKDLVEA